MTPFNAISCVELGFCGSVVDGVPRHVDDLIPKRGMITADHFADLVFEADGAVLEAYRETIRKAFLQFMGAAVVDVRWLGPSLAPSR